MDVLKALEKGVLKIGLPEGRSQRRDCTIRAFCYAFGISYDTMAALLEQWGKKKDGGMSTFAIEAFLQGELEDDCHTTGLLYGRYRFIKCNWEQRVYDFSREAVRAGKTKMKACAGMTVGTFAQTHRRGNFVLNVCGHVCACINGVIFDSHNSTGQRIQRVYKIERL